MIYRAQLTFISLLLSSLSFPLIAHASDASLVRLCAEVRIAPGMWPPSLAPRANENVSGFFAGALNKQLKNRGFKELANARVPK